MTMLFDTQTTVRRRRLVMLTLTEHCNLDCIYCYEKSKDKRRMPVSVAKSAIMKAFDDDFDEVEIDFHGGEPFLCFQEIKEICEWLWSNEWKKPFICFATTNGTLVHKKIRDWLVSNHNKFVCALSIDGTREMHNANRSNSFDQIDIDLFRELWPSQPVKMTISPQSVSRLAEGVIFLHNKGFLVECTHATGIDWTPADFSTFSGELEKLVAFYMQNPGIVPCRLVNMELGSVTPGSLRDSVKWCGTGTNMICVGMDGIEYPCHMFMPSSSGRKPQNKRDYSHLFQAFRDSKGLVDKRCMECCLIPVCPTCYGLNYVSSGEVAWRSDHDCAFAKIRAKASAYLLAHSLQDRATYKYLEEKNDLELLRLIDGIEVVNRDIQLEEIARLPS